MRAGDLNLLNLQQAIEQEPHFSHFAAVVKTFEWCHIDRKRAVVANFFQLLDELSVIDFTLTHTHMQLLFR